MGVRAFSVFREGAYRAEVVREAAEAVRAELGGPAAFALAFVSPDYIEHWEEFSETVRVDGHIPELIGATGSGLMAGASEHEGVLGFSLLAVRADGAVIDVLEFGDEDAKTCRADWKDAAQATPSWLLLANPFHFPSDEWLTEWNQAAPTSCVVGGLASGGNAAGSIAIFRNDHEVDGAVALGLGGSLRVIPAVSQGCRPIGDPLPVTRAEDNVIFSLGSRPAYQALESAFESLSDSEKSTAQGNLFVGLANNEYLETFHSGDFLIRNIIGADPNSGAVVIGGVPRVGQTIQYQIRDAAAAAIDLSETLETARRTAEPVLASILFACVGRGQRLFGEAGHDSAAVQETFGDHASVGLFSNGELGPIAGVNCAHSYTLSCALITTTTNL